MKTVGLGSLVFVVISFSGCGEDTTVNPPDQIMPEITMPASGTRIDRLKVTIEGTAEPEKAVEVLVDSRDNMTVTYTNDQGVFTAEDLPLGGQGRRVIWARMASDTTMVSQPVMIDVDFSALSYPLVLFPPHGSAIPAGSIPVAGFAPRDVSEVEILRDGTLVTTVESEAGSFFWPGFEPTGSGSVVLYARGKTTDGFYTAYGESIRVNVGGGQAMQLEAIESPVSDTLLSAEAVTVSGMATSQAALALFLNGGDTGMRTTALSGAFDFSPLSLILEGPQLLGIVTVRGGALFAEGATRIWVDHTDPFPPTIIRPAVNEIFRDPLITIEGAAEPYATVYLRLNDLWLDPVATYSTGAFSCELDLGSDGNFSLVAKAVDRAGNESGLTGERPITVDSAAPAPPTLVTPADGELVASETILVSGWAELGSWLELLVDGNIAVSQTVTGDDSFFVALATPTPDGSHGIAVRASSAPGAGWVRGDSTRISVDLTPPAAPIIIQPSESTFVSGETLRISGASEPGAAVTIFLDDQSVGQTTAGGFGSWALTVDLPAEDGSISFQASATDSAGHQGPLGPAHVLILDRTAPEVVISEPSPNSLASENPVTIQGDTEPAAVVMIDGIDVAVNAAGSFEAEIFLSEGYDTVTVAAWDIGGNTNALRLPLRLDTTYPFLNLTSPPESLITQSTNVTVAGTTEPGAAVWIQGAQVNVGPDGSFSTGIPMVFGWNTIEIMAVDEAGWETELSRTVIVDAVPTEPENLNPESGELVNHGRPILTMNEASDANGDDLTYTIQVFADAELQTLLAQSAMLIPSNNQIMWAVQPEIQLDGALRYWRARAYDGILYGAWSDVATFRMPDIGSRDPHKFFGYGDSITEGAQKYNGGWIPTVGYREALELALAAFFGDAMVARTYIPGGSTYDGVAQIQGDIAGTDAGYLLLLFGAIDAGETNMDAGQSAANVITMADYASQTLEPNMIVVIGTVPPSRDAERDARIQLLNAEITQRAAQEGYLLADHYTAMVEDAAGEIDSLVSEDGIHPSDRGYAVMAQVWFETIIGSDTYPLPNEFYLIDPSRRRPTAHAR